MFRYIPATEEDRKEMLDVIGINSVDELFDDIPKNLKQSQPLNIGAPMSEIELKKRIEELGNKNLSNLICFRGAGAYDHYIPAAVDHLISRSEFYTAYTPYQPEISQGTLQCIFEYQTMIADLTGMFASNASMYDGATAAAEAAMVAATVTKRQEIVVSKSVNPETRKVLKTYCKFRDIKVVEIELDEGATCIKDLKDKISDKTAGVMVQSPNFFGIIEDLDEIRENIIDKKTKYIVYTDLVAMGILKTPGESGADIVIGDAQSFGTGLTYGGPYLGFMTITKELIRKMPGRIVGESVDQDGKRCYVLTLQAREQHIRRYKATSNICSNHALNALAATIHMSLLGRVGLEKVAEQCYKKANYTLRKIVETDRYKLKFNRPFFREFVIEGEESPEIINEKLLKDGILGGYPLEKEYPELKNTSLVCITEKRSKLEIDSFVERMGEI
ncbi:MULTISPECIES: aminomethyl-transferring glycine dehydrogenase subunit GcvPA [Psychrilyobacter]|uniref:Probable glycine dehydrogenase (decarboxylating) subunit 1 n=1 Tax=Psychrilyobacter piezotolerans TaxID=2293438 RepID=A0ABX9KGB2_9FUSO|nr:MULTISPECIES: aminomethyl-transferring glycine dehydrogenase subunit GcvPA [Psychrilyobacter]MCS5422281.1 aminomethyl-transferring glycine dehydrogenase subunit GcvPA [Psychrilyobacter sp. S5]NDI78307.1 aminomethyl-transferring glycine dehydrogenase subunit GcvPA [Psychrilyobacter piezotolerans]RDE60844.1 aminomethyl-transferring glycine dehydrogenase subunit GcvPA [Psychrilyobacter sp. S5]REI40633.1 aminomethyl-transferring glycine dehydrogenase subunit GcvPA [Psychrilyobacter piezotolerans